MEWFGSLKPSHSKPITGTTNLVFHTVCCERPEQTTVTNKPFPVCSIQTAPFPEEKGRAGKVTVLFQIKGPKRSKLHLKKPSYGRASKIPKSSSAECSISWKKAPRAEDFPAGGAGQAALTGWLMWKRVGILLMMAESRSWGRLVAPITITCVTPTDATETSAGKHPQAGNFNTSHGISPTLSTASTFEEVP